MITKYFIYIGKIHRNICSLFTFYVMNKKVKALPLPYNKKEILFEYAGTLHNQLKQKLKSNQI